MRSMFVGQVLGLLVPVNSITPYGASISGLSTQWSLGGLNPQRGGIPHLGTGFPLRCLQRLSLPHVAMQPCHWRDNWHTRGSSVLVFASLALSSSAILQSPLIGTELSHDVLNP